MRLVRSIVTAGESGVLFAVGSSQNIPSGGTVERITVTGVNGQMASVPWYEIWAGGFIEVEVNSAHVEFVTIREGTS